MAKLNFDFYKNLKLEEKSNEILKNNIFTDVEVSLSNNSVNAINWYSFKENSNFLFIGDDLGKIIEYLCVKAKQVTLVEKFKKNAENISSKYSNVDNLEIICAFFDDIKFEKKFEYIILYGVIENLKLLNITEKNIEVFIKNISKLLSENGHILIYTDNKFGAKKFTGVVENDFEKPYDSILGNSELLSKFEIEDLLKKLNLNFYKFYYMLPDYKFTNVIYSDDYLPQKDDSKIVYNKYCNEKSLFTFDEITFLKEVIKEEKFDFFCNSFCVDISIEDENKSNDLKTEVPKFISFNNMRKDKFKLITKIYDDFVIKEPQNENSKEHIKNIASNIEKMKKNKISTIDEYKDEKIYSEFLHLKTYDKMLLDLIEKNDFDNFLKNIELWYNYIKDKLVPKKYDEKLFSNNIFSNCNILIEKEILENMNFVEDGFIDFVFENTFLDEHENFIFYDQEWFFENVPVEYILYRALNNLFSYNDFLENKISKSSIYKYFDIIKFENTFKEFETYFQNIVLDEVAKTIYNEVYLRNLNNYIQNIKDENEKELNAYLNIISKKNEELELKEKDILAYQKIMKEKEEEFNNKILNLENQLNYIYNTKTWKYTKIFRKKR